MKDHNVVQKNIFQHCDWKQADWPALILTGLANPIGTLHDQQHEEPVHMEVTLTISHFEIGRVDAAKILMWNSCFWEHK